jgi:hypothetical protein
MDGAVRTYNLALAEAAEACGLRPEASLTTPTRDGLAVWADEMRANGDSLRRWDRSAMWTRLHALNPRIPAGAHRFVESWVDAAIHAPVAAIDDRSVRELIARREQRLKGPLARLQNERALERWSGSSGIGRMSYRWLPEGRQIVSDILDGLDRPPEDE